MYDATGPIKEYRTLVNPGIPIPEAVTKLTGITDAMVQGCRTCGYALNGHPIGKSDECVDVDCIDPKPVPTFKQLANSLSRGFTNCDFANQNIRFDLRILQAEMTRAGVEWSYVGARIIDTHKLEQIAVPRSLSHLHEKYTGLKHDGAHGALSDVRAAATVIAKQLETHDALPRDLAKLHEMSWPGELDEGGKFKMVSGVATCQFGKHRGKAMRDIPVDYFDWLLKSDFPADVKTLAANAKLGKYPEAQ